MTPDVFINDYVEAFGSVAPLPIAFYYSDCPLAATEKIAGCLFKYFDAVKNGEIVSLNADNITCGGGRLYTGFAAMPEHVPTFVCEKEKYKNTKEAVVDYVKNLDIEMQNGRWLNFVRIDKLTDFDEVEGVMFFSTPDMLSGLMSWANYDNHAEDAVMTPFGSGCSATISYALRENRRKGDRCFLGLFDPSVRPFVKSDELCFVIPASRFRIMCETMKNTCLFGTKAWEKVRNRIEG